MHYNCTGYKQIGFAGNGSGFIMNPFKLYLAVVAVALVFLTTGCTTQPRRDGSSLVRISNPFAGDGGKAQQATAPTFPLVDANGVVSLDGVNPPWEKAKTGPQLVFLNGRFSYPCMAIILYSAKSGESISLADRDYCSADLSFRQGEYRARGYPYDANAPYKPITPSGGPSDEALVYWEATLDALVPILRQHKRFKTTYYTTLDVRHSSRLETALAIDRSKAGFTEPLFSTPLPPEPVSKIHGASLMTVNPQIPALPNKPSDKPLQIGMALCTAILDFDGTKDKSVYTSPWGDRRNVVLFTAANSNCVNAAK